MSLPQTEIINGPLLAPRDILQQVDHASFTLNRANWPTTKRVHRCALVPQLLCTSDRDSRKSPRRQLSGIELLKNGVHDSRGQKDFPVWDGQRAVFNNRTIETFNQIFHARLTLEVLCQEGSHVANQIFNILLGEYSRGKEFLEVAFESFPAKLDHCLVVPIENHTVFLAKDAKLVQRGTHL